MKDKIKTLTQIFIVLATVCFIIALWGTEMDTTSTVVEIGLKGGLSCLFALLGIIISPNDFHK